MLLGMLIGRHSPTEVVVLIGTAVIVVAAGIPLLRHLWATPSNAPGHLPHRSRQEDTVAAAIDRYSTRWGGGWAEKKDNPR
jgi:hypothetical protein